MIYYVNENKRYDNIFNCIMEASSIVSDIRVFPYENNDEWVNESAKDAIAKFFSGLVEKIRAFFRKIKEFFTKKKTDGKIESAKKEVSSNSIVDMKINVPDPNKLEFEKSISKIEIAILGALEQTPPELYADIVNKGIYLAGGGA